MMALKALLKMAEDKTQRRNALWMKEEEQRSNEAGKDRGQEEEASKQPAVR